ncbi:MAG TPA: c-type cytochrome [Dyella sp.]|nr:c-type cytochrome [Dyella sp.]
MTTHPRSLRGAALLLACLLVGAAHAADGTPRTVPDTLAQRIASCTACHGEHGEGSPDTGFFPRLAGKPAEYLARQLRYFQLGLRKYGPMEYTVRPLSDAYMHEIADYFAQQQVPYSPSPTPRVSDALMVRGQTLTEHGDPGRKIPPCQACHGSQLTGVEPSTPGLVGLPYDYVSSQLGSWRTGTRAAAAPDCMATVANRLTPDDITAVSAYLATRQLPADLHAQPAGTVTPPLQCGVLGNAAPASAPAGGNGA